MTVAAELFRTAMNFHETAAGAAEESVRGSPRDLQHINRVNARFIGALVERLGIRYVRTGPDCVMRSAEMRR
jgi:hypothetical protein